MKLKLVRSVASGAVSIMLVLATQQAASAYSVLTHEAIIDGTWDDSIKPLLAKRFPRATADQFREARAYSYGGAIIQDMGYYPFGSKTFSDLVHYVRSGDFIEALLREAGNLNEYAFALGALAHYAADNEGHSIAVNPVVPVLYPKLRAKYGNRVTYAEDPIAHLRTEFGFDVLQVVRNRYASQSYHDFIGFEVSKPVLERAFKHTYGVELKDLFGSVDLALATFRRSVSVVIPEMTKVAWETKKDEIEKAAPGVTRERFIYNLSRADYEKEWGGQYEKPGGLEKTLAVFLRIMPKVGPLAPLSFRPATPEAERLFVESLDATLTRYRALLRQARAGTANLQNTDFDTGKSTRAGEYKLADKTYAKLLKRLDRNGFSDITPELRQNILAFYSDLNAPIETKKDREEWQDTLQALNRLKAAVTQASRNQ
ncbi:MAG TPA: zinc dependent phospholipase C family protein [Blastocatellia bacterium]|nr:zinc dependent phospholipase C family protein [Blastocatellia bacterium]